jgi:hypothetical protein
MKRPFEMTFFKLKNALGDVSELSIRKQMCFKYIEWKARGLEKYKREWIDLTVEFRKIEGRIGSKRTKLEKLARGHFRQRRQLKGNEASREGARAFAQRQYEEGIGIHSPEMKARRSETAKENMRRQTAENRNSNTKDWVITCKEGGEYVIRNLRAFCREHDINYRNLHFTAVSNWWAKGFRARKFDSLTDSHIPTREEFEKGRETEP